MPRRDADLDGAPQASPRASTAMRGPSMTLGPAIQSPSYLLSVKWRLLVYCLQRLYPIAVAKLDRAIQ
jgi:hypothetical protein